jgi:hypothetical protein
VCIQKVILRIFLLGLLFALGIEATSFLIVSSSNAAFLQNFFRTKLKRYSEKPDPCGNAQKNKKRIY